MAANEFMIGIDVGGTFTDLIAIDELGEIFTEKVPSTPADPSVGVLKAIGKVSTSLDMSVEDLLSNTKRFVYGTTVATNTLLQRKGVDTALITTKGFRDNLNIRRMWREDTFDLRALPPTPIVFRDKIFEVTERIDSEGNVVEPLEESELVAIMQKLGNTNIDSIAVCLLFSFQNPVHERKIKDFLSNKLRNMRVSLSSEVCPEIREYERASTVVINAYLAGTVGKHLEHLEDQLMKKGLAVEMQIMQSNGGVTTTGFVADRPVSIFLSGPAGGIVASTFLGEKIEGNEKNFLTVDMGGTSFDICLLPERRFSLSRMNLVHGWHIVAPIIDIHTIGAGGGSVAWLDSAGGLHVGPQSAGAVPGPACYMRGGQEATVTDANLVMGYLNPDYFLGGEMKLSLEKAEEVIGKISNQLGLSLMETANGIFRIINNNMLGGMRVVTVEKGFDPRDYTLVVFGGAAAIHLPAIAPELGIKHIVIPRDASVFSAVGLVVSNVRYDFVRNVNRSIEEITLDELLYEYQSLMKKGRMLLSASGVNPKDIYFEIQSDLKFPGQYRELTVDLPSDLNSLQKVEDTFKDSHERLYGFVEGTPPELVNIRVTAIGKMSKPTIAKAKLGGENCDSAIKARRNVYLHEEGKDISIPIYDGRGISPGNKLQGPAIIEVPKTTIVVRPGQSLFMDELSNFNIEC